MARLKTMPPRIKPLAPRLAPQPVTVKREPVRTSTSALPRFPYGTARWKKLRRERLRFDGYICQATGTPLVGKYPAWNSPAVDHKTPHRGNPDLFYDFDNLQSVTKQYHDTEKQRIEHAGKYGDW